MERCCRANLDVSSANVNAREVKLDSLEVGRCPRRLHVRELVALHDVAAQPWKQSGKEIAWLKTLNCHLPTGSVLPVRILQRHVESNEVAVAEAVSHRTVAAQ